MRVRAVRMPPVNGINGLPLDGDAPERRREPEPIAQTLARLLGRHRLHIDESPSTLLDDWAELAGHELAARLRPGKCERQILYAYAASSAELFEIRRFKLRELEARIRRHPRYQTIRQVRLQLDPGQPPDRN